MVPEDELAVVLLSPTGLGGSVVGTPTQRRADLSAVEPAATDARRAEARPQALAR